MTDREQRRALQPLVLPNRRYAVTLALAGVCVVMGILSYVWGWGDLHDVALWNMGANNGVAVRGGEFSRIFAAVFLHVNWIHLLVNMMALFSFGLVLETLLGPRRYLLLYAGSGLAGSIASAVFNPTGFSVGASGAIWGLMTAGIGIALRPKGLLPPHAIPIMRRQVWVPLVINVLYSFSPGIDKVAHFGGGIAGFLLSIGVLTHGLVPLGERSATTGAETKERPLLTLTCAVAALAMAVSVIAALLSGQPWRLDRPLSFERTTLPGIPLSLELPTSLVRMSNHTEEDGRYTFVFGTLASSPVAIVVVVAATEPEVAPDQIRQVLEQERSYLDKTEASTRLLEPARFIELGPRLALRVRHEKSDHSVQILSYETLIGRYSVLVQGVSRPKRLAHWEGVEERVTRSLGLGASK